MKELFDPKAIVTAQEQLDRQLKEILPDQGTHRLGFRGGGKELTLYSEGRGRLYYASTFIDQRGAAPRYWNAFGLYDGRPSSTQRIAVEINIPIPPTRHVAAFFARETSSGDILLLHDGKLGGGKEGVTRQAFLDHSGLQLQSAASSPSDRRGIVVTKLGNTGLVHDIENFVRKVLEFKESVDSA